MNFVINHSYLIPLLPLLAAIACGFFGDRYFKTKAHWPVWIAVGISAVLSLIVLIGMAYSTHNSSETFGQGKDFYTWFSAGDQSTGADLAPTVGFYFDPLTAIMLSIVTGIGLLITIFSASYMKGEDGYARFFAYLGLFIFSMTVLVMAENLVLLYLGWEGVGLCSYLLIGYYYQRPAASAAASKAFIVNRIGDFGFAVGIMTCFWAFGSVSLLGNHGILKIAHDVWLNNNTSMALSAQHPNVLTALKYLPFLLMLGAFGKSAQFPLYVWLPDAMEGPTPVSALIHAATMVTAGVYMIVRCGPLFVTSQAALWTIAAVGAFTALFAATIALRQFDLKKVFAYSTVSQLGYMFVAVGVLAPTAAVFHLLTHAFFKALLFLGSGVVMHAMLGHLDLRKMSGLKKVLPKTNIVVLIGCAALAGFPFTSGFFSKDEIVAQAFSHSLILGGVLLFTSFLTAYYTFRLYFQVFQGPLLVPTTPPQEEPATTEHAEARGSHEAVTHPPVAGSGVDHAAAQDDHHDHEPWLMLGPLIALAIGALCIGWIFFRGTTVATFLGHSPSVQLAYDMAHVRFDRTGGVKVDPEMYGMKPEAANRFADEPIIPWAMLFGGIASVAGIGLAYLLHLKDRARAERIAAGLQPLTGLLEGKYWIDDLYDAAVVKPLRHLGKIFFAVDRLIIDRVVWITGMVPQLSGTALRLTMQRGYLQGYAATMLFGVLAILLLCFL
jgi:NADH-quinone oxidoreductase subunit L